MKKILLTLAAVAMIFAGCESSLEDRVSRLENRVSELEAFVTNLNAEVEGIQTIVSNLQKNVYVTGVEPIKNASGVEIGYKLTFNQGNPIEIKHGNTGAVGETGAAGKTPTIDLYEGEWYWKYSGGDWIKDSQDNMIPVTEEIEFSVKDGVLYVTINGEEKALGSVKGEQGDSMFEGVTVNEEKGTVIIDLKGTDNNLVLPFNAAAADEFALELQLPSNTSVLLGNTFEITYTLTGCDAADAAVFVQAPEDWTVELNETTKKIALTVGEKAGRVVVYAINNVSGEVRAKFVAYDPAQMLIVGVKETEFYLNPTGGEIVIPVSSGVAYKTNVSASWLTVEKAPATKAVEHTVVTIKADKNIEGKAREAEVLISRVSDGAIVLTFTVSQESVLMSLIQDEEGNPIEWEETFGVYSDQTAAQAATNPQFSYKNTFTIELSDDFSMGTYKLNGAFVENNSYTGKTGGVYYANYEDGVFSVKKSSSGYAFDSNVITLNYNEETKEFTNPAPIKFNSKFDNADMRNGGYIGGYKAVVKVKTEGGDQNTGSIVGTYTATVNFKNNGTPATKTETITISENSDAKGQYKITGMFDQYGNGGGTYYANYENGVLTILAANADNMYIGTMSGDIKMAHNGIAFASEQGVTAGSYGYVLTDYMAYPENISSGIVGTYKATVNFKNNGTPATKTETITISENSDAKGQYKITGMFDQYGNGGGTYYANYENGVLTILAANADNMYIGTMSGDIKMNLSSLVFASSAGVSAGSYGYVLTSYVAK